MKSKDHEKLKEMQWVTRIAEGRFQCFGGISCHHIQRITEATEVGEYVVGFYMLLDFISP